MARKRVRPLGKAVPYKGRNWVIGGAEPNSWEIAKGEIEELKKGRKSASSLAVKMTKPFPAKFAKTCFQCGQKWDEGAQIVKAQYPNGDLKYVHAGCAR